MPYNAKFDEARPSDGNGIGSKSGAEMETKRGARKPTGNKSHRSTS